MWCPGEPVGGPEPLPPTASVGVRHWGRSSAGRALDWQSRGSWVQVPSPPLSDACHKPVHAVIRSELRLAVNALSTEGEYECQRRIDKQSSRRCSGHRQTKDLACAQTVDLPEIRQANGLCQLWRARICILCFSRWQRGRFPRSCIKCHLETVRRVL